jgi:PAS domain S-box-containing protein
MRPERFLWRWRESILAGALVTAAVASFVVVRHAADGAARREADHRAELVALQVESSAARAVAYVDTIRGYLVSHPTVSGAGFSSFALGILGVADLNQVAWVESVSHARRTRYEASIGRQITEPRGRRLVRAPRRREYYPATLITQVLARNVPGVDLGAFPQLRRVLGSSQALFSVVATAPVDVPGASGVFFVEAAPRREERGNMPGFVVVFVPVDWLEGSLGSSAGPVEIRVAGGRAGALRDGGRATARSFASAARRWQVLVPSGRRSTAASALAWSLLAAGLMLAALTLLIGAGSAARRRATDELDRIFRLSRDLICTAGFDGWFKRVNPAFARTLGYSTETLLSRPTSEFVHPDDRELRDVGHAALERGEEIARYELRQLCSDGSTRWIEWSAYPVPEERLMYAVGRDVTESRRAADEQAALRRVATLVARGVPATEIFDAVALETRRLLDVETSVLQRLESDGSVTLVAADTTVPLGTEAGDRFTPPADGVVAQVLRTGAPARVDSAEGATDPGVARLRISGFSGSVGAPVVVEGRVWGVIAAAWTTVRPLPEGIEHRLAEFTELLGTAIANAQSRAELVTSRARVVAAGDDARRRIERDLHDGVQQRLVVLELELRTAENMAAAVADALRERPAQISHELGGAIDRLAKKLAQTSDGLAAALDELRELSLGIHPPILRHGGLGPAIHALARRSAVRVEVDVLPGPRLPEHVEIAAYFVVSEALANASRHAGASVVEVSAASRDGWLDLTVRDDGVGGATSISGTGLTGLRDRVEAVGGKLRISSPPGRGTVLQVALPLEPVMVEAARAL